MPRNRRGQMPLICFYLTNAQLFCRANVITCYDTCLFRRDPLFSLSIGRAVSKNANGEFTQRAPLDAAYSN